MKNTFTTKTFTMDEKKMAYPYVADFKSPTYTVWMHDSSTEKFLEMPDDIFYSGAWTEVIYDLTRDDALAERTIFLLTQYYGEVLKASEIVELLTAYQH